MSVTSNPLVPSGHESPPNSEVESEEDVGKYLEAAAKRLNDPSTRHQRDRTRRTPTLSPPPGGYRRKKTDWNKIMEQGRKIEEEWERQHPGEKHPFAFSESKNDWRASTRRFVDGQTREAEERYRRTKELQESGVAEESPFAHALREAAQENPRLRRSARIRELEERKAKPQGIQKNKAPPRSSTTKRKQPSKVAKRPSEGLLQGSAAPASTVSAGRTIVDIPAQRAAPKERRNAKSQRSKGKPRGVREKMLQPSKAKPRGVQKKKSAARTARTKREGP